MHFQVFYVYIYVLTTSPLSQETHKKLRLTVKFGETIKSMESVIMKCVTEVIRRTNLSKVRSITYAMHICCLR